MLIRQRSRRFATAPEKRHALRAGLLGLSFADTVSGTCAAVWGPPGSWGLGTAWGWASLQAFATSIHSLTELGIVAFTRAALSLGGIPNA